MENDIIAQMEKLQLLAFFSGYAFLFILISQMADWYKNKPTSLIIRLFKLLPLTYAFTGLLFGGFVLKNWYLNVQSNNSMASFGIPYLTIVGLLSVLFFIPIFRKKPFLSFLHSLIFFSFILKDFLFYLNGTTNREVIHNDMNILWVSILLNVCSLGVVSLLLFFKNRLSLSSAIKYMI